MTTIIGAETAKLAGLQVDSLQKVRSGQITLDQWEWFNGLTREQREALMVNGAATAEPAKTKPKPKPKSKTILRLISEEEHLVIGATDGTEIIADATDTFPGWIDSDFRAYGADEASGPTVETPVAVYEMVKDATFAQMFGSLGADTQKLCLTQSQIIGFVKAHRDWLRTDGYATFFLVRSKGKFFVASVSFVDGGRLGVYVRRFEGDRAWSAVYRHRLVVPQL